MRRTCCFISEHQEKQPFWLSCSQGWRKRFRKPRVSPPGRRWGQGGVSSLLWGLMTPGMQLLCPDLYPWESQWASSSSQPSFPVGNSTVCSPARSSSGRGDAQGRVFIPSLASWAFHPPDLPNWPLQSCPKPSSTGSCFSVPATMPAESQPSCGHWVWALKPSPAQETQTQFYFVFSFLCWVLCPTYEFFPGSLPSQAFLAVSSMPCRQPFIRRAPVPEEELGKDDQNSWAPPQSFLLPEFIQSTYKCIWVHPAEQGRKRALCLLVAKAPYF